MKVPRVSAKKPVTIGKLKKMLSIGLLIVVVIIFTAFTIFTKNKIVQAEILDELPIPVLEKPINRGEKIQQANLTFVKWDRKRIPAGSIINVQNLIGKVATQNLIALLPLTTNNISENISDVNRVVEQIPMGMRAITVKVDVESAVEGWAQSGNRVDVLIVRSNGETLEAKVIAENVQILSAGRSTEAKNTEENAPKTPNTATLLVTQDDALRIKAASSIGRITFALRGGSDNAPTQTTKIDQKSIFGDAIIKRELKGVAKSPDGKTYVLRGSSRWMETLAPQNNLTLDEKNN